MGDDSVAVNTYKPERRCLKVKKTGIFICIILAFLSVMVSGCATSKTATQQLMEQTDDIQTIALGTYADALTVYTQAQDTYLLYQTYLEENRPELNEKILEQFKQAREIRLKWKGLGAVGDTTEFRDLLRNALLMIAQEIDEEGGDG